jgi:hypothetical protein
MASRMGQLFAQLWNDDEGALVTTEYLALGSVVALGGVAGMAALRDATVAEMQDYGNSIRQMRQTYSVPGFQGAGASKAGSAAVDQGGRGCSLTP